MDCSKSELFAGIRQSECDAMMCCFEVDEVSYRNGEMIGCMEANGDKVGILESGKALLMRIDVDGNQTILEHLDAGGVFGSMLSFSALTGDSVFVVADGKCRVIFISYEAITKRCEKACTHHSILVQNMFRLMTDKAMQLSERVEILSQRTIRDKLMCYFWILSRKAGKASFDLPLSLSKLSDFISSDRSAMMRELKKMREENILQVENRHVEIYDFLQFRHAAS